MADLVPREPSELAPAEQFGEFRRTMARNKAAAGIARQQARVFDKAKEDDAAREAILAAISAEAECLEAEADAGRWLQELAEHGERARASDNQWSSQLATTTLKSLGISKSESSRWQQIAAVPDDLRLTYVETVKRRRQRWVSRQRLLRLWRELQADQRRQEPVQVSAPGAPDVRVGDFRVVLNDIGEGTVDAIVTDPPYPREFLSLYGDLSVFAARVLRPSGVLAVMCGQSYLFEYLGLLGTALEYRWTAAYVAHGQRTRMHEARVGTGWKPILLYQRRDAEDVPFLLNDVFDSSLGADKRFHHWGQSESGTAGLVEALSKPGALVVDPFLGGGTTAVVCRDLGRQFIGCDVDAAAVSVTQERLAD